MNKKALTERNICTRFITESLRDYTCKNVRTAFSSLDDFLTSWNHADKKRAFGGKPAYDIAIHTLTVELYKSA